MDYLIDNASQRAIAERIDRAVSAVLDELPNHGSEEGLTSVLGHALMQQSFEKGPLRVKFSYRQLSKYTEEPRAGADGGFLVRVANRDTSVQKAALFQAKLMIGHAPVRQLSIRGTDAERLTKQAADMLCHTDQAVVIFYTAEQVYVVDAAGYHLASADQARYPLASEHRLITLGTYLGRWLPRCTKGDESPELNKRIEHLDGFKHGISLNVVTQNPSVTWKKG